MKTISKILVGIGLFAGTLGFTSCDKFDGDDNLSIPSALVTVKPSEDGASVLLQLDDDTVLWPVNIRKSPFGDKEVRALVNYRKPTEAELSEGGILSGIENVYVNWMDSILTKPMAADLGAEKNKETYGTAPVDIINDWVTLAEDGYLNLRLRTYYSPYKHIVNLVHRADSDDPYRVTLYHEFSGTEIMGSSMDGLVAFRLEGLPDTGGEYVDLTLEWESYNGPATAKFKYRSRN